MSTDVRPRLFGLTAQFYGWLAKGELRLQRCTCGVYRHVPRVLCPSCGGDRWDWAPCSGRGELYSWTTTMRPLHPAFTTAPFTIATVALDEGPRVLAPLVDGDTPKMGLRLRAVVTPVDDTLGTLSFRAVTDD